MAPTTQERRGGRIHQAWSMNSDAPAFVYKIDCLYTMTDKFIRIDAGQVKRCDFSFQQASNGASVTAPGAIFFCD